jgi:hypothetical protein
MNPRLCSKSFAGLSKLQRPTGTGFLFFAGSCGES